MSRYRVISLHSPLCHGDLYVFGKNCVETETKHILVYKMLLEYQEKDDIIAK